MKIYGNTDDAGDWNGATWMRFGFDLAIPDVTGPPVGTRMMMGMGRWRRATEIDLGRVRRRATKMDSMMGAGP